VKKSEVKASTASAITEIQINPFKTQTSSKTTRKFAFTLGPGHNSQAMRTTSEVDLSHNNSDLNTYNEIYDAATENPWYSSINNTDSNVFVLNSNINRSKSLSTQDINFSSKHNSASKSQKKSKTKKEKVSKNEIEKKIKNRSNSLAIDHQTYEHLSEQQSHKIKKGIF